MKTPSARPIARYVVGVAILVLAQSTVAPHPIHEVAVVRAHCSAFLRIESQSATSLPSQKQKLSNPLNDLLDEAQRAIDKSDFAAAIPPLQKFLTEKSDVAYAHFQLAYAYTALKRVAEARAEYER